MRVPPSLDKRVLLDQFDKWIQEIGEGVYIDVEGIDGGTEDTRIDESNIFWEPLKKGITETGYKVKTDYLPATTDMRYIRKARD